MRKTKIRLSDLTTPVVAAQMLTVSRSTIYNWINWGILDSYRRVGSNRHHLLLKQIRDLQRVLEVANPDNVEEFVEVNYGSKNK